MIDHDPSIKLMIDQGPIRPKYKLMMDQGPIKQKYKTNNLPRPKYKTND